MVSKPNLNPDDSPLKGPNPISDSQPAAPSKTWNPKPLNWMGMSFNSEQTKQLWSVISQTIAQAIQKDRDRAVAAIKKLGKSTDPDNQDDD